EGDRRARAGGRQGGQDEEGRECGDGGHEPRRALVHAEQCERAADEPVEGCRLVPVRLAVEAGHHPAFPAVRREHLAADLGVARLVGFPHRVAVQPRAQDERGDENDQDECLGERRRSRHGLYGSAGRYRGDCALASEKPRSCPASPATLYRTWMPTTAPGRLVLASASPRRRELLGAVGLGFDLAPADLDEEALSEGLAPEASALAVAAAKAAAP